MIGKNTMIIMVQNNKQKIVFNTITINGLKYHL